MRYPYIVYSPKVTVQPLFKGLKSDPLILDMSNEGHFLTGMDVRNQRECQRRIDWLMAEGGHSWGISSYLENRKQLLADCPQMVEEQRFYHLGIDIIVPLDTPLHVPLAATVDASGYEAGEGNYGGYVLLRHQSPDFETFYSMYGHLRRDTLPAPGRSLQAGEIFAHIGDFNENGNWFYHTHLQIITEQGVVQGYRSKGYCAAAELPLIGRLCPDPLPLFRP